ncbi:MAG: IPT/TIG domain-containing protein, partial [Limisphaerales bacterium]
LNAASLDKRLCPGIYADAFGTNLSLTAQDADVSVTVNNEAVFVQETSASELIVVLPGDIMPGPANVVVTSHGLASAPFAITLDTVAPGIFTANNLGTGTGFFLNGNNNFGPQIGAGNPAQPGENIQLFATGLGATSPVIPPGIVPQGAVKPLIQPAITVGGQAATITNMYLNAPEAPGNSVNYGTFLVQFTVPGNIASGAQPVILTSGGVQSNTVTLPISTIRVPIINALDNSGSFQQYSISPGSIISIFGLNFGADDDYSLFPSTSFEGISVTFNGTPAPLFAVSGSQSQINVYVPAELQASKSNAVSIQVTNKQGTSASFALSLLPDAPGIYRLTDPSNLSNGSAAALLAGTAWLAISSSLSNALKIPTNCSTSGINRLSTCGQPAKVGDIIELFLTGLGKATPNGDPAGQVLSTGTTAPSSGDPLYKTVATPQVMIGKIPAKLLFSGLAPGFAGLYQLDVEVPSGVTPGDNVEIEVTMPDNQSDSSSIAVQ